MSGDVDPEPLPLPCSQSQKRFWFESQVHGENPGLNVAVRWRLEGWIVQSHLEQAWQLIVARHQTLRSSFTTVDGVPHQVVAPNVRFHIPVVDLTTLGEAQAANEAERVAEIEARRTFDVTIAPLVRVTHVRIRSDVSMILVTAHHTVCDGWSIGVLAHEMGTVCEDLAAGRVPNLPELPVTYADYVAWEQAALRDVRAGAEMDEFEASVRDFEPFEILADKSRPRIQSANGEIVSTLLARETTDALAAIARENGCTLFVAAYAALLVLLRRYSGQTNIVIGTQIAGREELEFEPLVGTFVNTLSLRTDVAGDPSFADVLERALDSVTNALEMRLIPLEELVETVKPQRDLSRNALFSVNFVFQRSFVETKRYGHFRLIDLPSRSAGPISDLNFFMVERPDGWRFSCEFNTDLYRHGTVRGMLDRFVRLLRAVVAEPARSIATIPLLDEVERSEMIALGIGPATDYGAHRTVHALFAERAASTPAAIAAIDATDSLTYAELDRRSNRMARFLQAAGVGHGSAVGVALERSVAVPVVLLGILKAGASYVPLDPSYPRERLEVMAGDADVRLVVTDDDRMLHLGEDRPVVRLAEVAAAIAAYDDGPCEGGAPDDAAYVMYTSGSTGVPKGVAIPHRAIARLVRATNYVAVRATDTVLQYAPLGFDASTFEMWAPLLCGGRVAFAPPGTLSLAALDRTLDRFSVSVLWLTAALFREAVEGGVPAFAALRTMLAGGDVVSPSHVKRFLDAYPGCRFVNGYGPTENTTFSCCHVLSAPYVETNAVPIGRPIANSSAHVLDERMQLVPFGVIGELCVGGDGLAKGYLRRPELTAERFVADPFRPNSGALLYRTGDRVRRRPDGVIEFVGRIDEQVKIRGYRIELAEIEAVLASHPDVADAVAIVGERNSGDKAIVAYVVPRGATPESFRTGVLLSWLAERLPAYMLPSAIVASPPFALTSNGKVDTRALPPLGDDVRAAGSAPVSVIAARLAAIAAELLEIEAIPANVDLFSLGFHSLLAVRFAARIAAELGFDLKMRALFEHPTIAAIAARIEAAPGDGDGAPAATILALNKNGTKTPLVFFHGDLFADGLYARRLAAALGADQPVYSIAPHGTAGLPLLRAVDEMARDYLERIRDVLPNGPYRLGGFCASGLVAYHVASLLRARGETVDRVILLNSSPMPARRIAPFDWLVRAVGSNARLKPRLRDALCYGLSRLHASLVAGPHATLSFCRRMLDREARRSTTSTDLLEPVPFAHRRGPEQTANSFGHIVAALTYHPRSYAGDLTLIWGEDQPAMFDDPTMGWGEVAARVRIVPMRGGHVGALLSRIGDVAVAVEAALADDPNLRADDPGARHAQG